MINKPVISVIIPIYNAEKHLNLCIDSVLNQTFESYEVLLIDDGSTDKSSIICDDYFKSNDKVRVFYKKNGGVSSARNIGIKEARGIYSIHVDADDFIEKNMLEEMFSVAKNKNIDVVISDYYYVVNGQKRYKKQPVTISNTDCINNFLTGKLHAALWNKLIKHSLYKEHNISFKDNITYQEDLVVMINILLYTKKIAYLPKAFYHYMHTENSYTNNRTKKSFISQFEVVKTIGSLLHGKKEFEISLIEQKLNVKVAIALFDHNNHFNLRDIYPETDFFIFSSKRLSFLQKIYLWNASKNMTYINKLLLFFKK